MIADAQSSTKLRPPWLNITRAIWIVLTILALLAFIASTLIAINEPLPSCLEPGALCGPWTITREDIALAAQLGLPVNLLLLVGFGSSILAKLAFFVVGLIVFVRRSDDWVAQMLSLMLVLFAVEGIQNLGPFMPVVVFLYTVATLIFTVIPFIFPNGRFVPGWTKWLMLPLLAMTFGSTAAPLLGFPLSQDQYAAALIVPFVLWFVTACYATVHRYRSVSNTVERQQTKWVVAGILGTFLLFIPFIIASIWFPPATQSPERLAFMFLVFVPIYIISYLCIPVGIAFAILRYRLWDIDIIIRKTLVYATLTALLALVFFGIVTLASSLLTAASGQNSPIVIVAATLTIAALFTPLRRRIQEAIDRRFYRKKYDAQQVLADFARHARDETDLDALTAELARVVEETMHPERVSVWLRHGKLP
ncbi:MAG: hypothetical protein J5I90_13290 [Caldilineales bacterium]|nr:hypothetical protein [Caldilineales bacterium]